MYKKTIHAKSKNQLMKKAVMESGKHVANVRAMYVKKYGEKLVRKYDVVADTISVGIGAAIKLSLEELATTDNAAFVGKVQVNSNTMGVLYSTKEGKEYKFNFLTNTAICPMYGDMLFNAMVIDIATKMLVDNEIKAEFEMNGLKDKSKNAVDNLINGVEELCKKFVA